jgi:thiamine pyrophosphokinase
MSFRMDNAIVESHHGVTLLGGGQVGARLLARALALAPGLVAADGGADHALRLGHEPQAVIGDMDSVSDAARHRLAGRLHRVAEQDTTDFDKALRRIRAPFVLGLGFAGPRADHALAVLNALVRHAQRRCLILSGTDVTFLAPPRLVLRLPVGTRLSLFPMGPVSGRSIGLRWPIDGLRFAPDAMIGTSNQVVAPEVVLDFDAPRMLVILPGGQLRAALAALGPPQPVRGG